MLIYDGYCTVSVWADIQLLCLPFGTVCALGTGSQCTHGKYTYFYTAHDLGSGCC